MWGKQRQRLACLKLNNNPVIRAQKAQCCPMDQAEEFRTPYFPTSQVRERCLRLPAILGGNSTLQELFITHWATRTLSAAQDAPGDAGSAGGSTWVYCRAYQGLEYGG